MLTLKCVNALGNSLWSGFKCGIKAQQAVFAVMALALWPAAQTANRARTHKAATSDELIDPAGTQTDVDRGVRVNPTKENPPVFLFIDRLIV